MDIDEAPDGDVPSNEDDAASQIENVEQHQLANAQGHILPVYSPEAMPVPSRAQSTDRDAATDTEAHVRSREEVDASMAAMPAPDESVVPETPRRPDSSLDPEPELPRTPIPHTVADPGSVFVRSRPEEFEHPSTSSKNNARTDLLESTTSTSSVRSDPLDFTKESNDTTSTTPAAQNHTVPLQSSTDPTDPTDSTDEASETDVESVMEQEYESEICRRSGSSSTILAKLSAASRQEDNRAHSADDLRHMNPQAFDTDVSLADDVPYETQPEPPQTVSVVSPASEATSRDSPDVASQESVPSSPLSSPMSFPSRSSMVQPSLPETSTVHEKSASSASSEQSEPEEISPILIPLSPSIEQPSVRGEVDASSQDEGTISEAEDSPGDGEEMNTPDGSQARDIHGNTELPDDHDTVQNVHVQSNDDDDVSVQSGSHDDDDVSSELGAANRTSWNDLSNAEAQWTERNCDPPPPGSADAAIVSDRELMLQDESNVFDISSSADKQSSPLGRKSLAARGRTGDPKREGLAGLDKSSAGSMPHEATPQNFCSIQQKERAIRDSYKAFGVDSTGLHFSPKQEILKPMFICTNTKASNAILTTKSFESLLKQRDQLLQPFLGDSKRHTDKATTNSQADTSDLNLIRKLCGLNMGGAHGHGVVAAMESLCHEKLTTQDSLNLIEFRQYSVLTVAFQYNKDQVSGLRRDFDAGGC